MLTKILIWLFVPSKWTIIAEHDVSFKTRPAGTWEWFNRKGTRYTLQNQWGDLKFKTILVHGEEC